MPSIFFHLIQNEFWTGKRDQKGQKITRLNYAKYPCFKFRLRNRLGHVWMLRMNLKIIRIHPRGEFLSIFLQLSCVECDDLDLILVSV